MFIVSAIVTINKTAIWINFVLDKGQRPPYLSNHIINILRQTYLLTSKPFTQAKINMYHKKVTPIIFFSHLSSLRIGGLVLGGDELQRSHLDSLYPFHKEQASACHCPGDGHFELGF